MKIIKFSVLVFSISALSISCTKEDVGPEPTIADYLPLEVGNYWMLENTTKREVTGVINTGNTISYMMVTEYDTAYYRKANNKIYVKQYGHSEALKFDLSADEHSSWAYNLYTVRLQSKTDTIVFSNAKIFPCYSFYFDIPGMADEEHTIWLAPCIGFIQEQCGECMYPIRKLDKAQIGGEVIDF